jgi:hypothetical protein
MGATAKTVIKPFLIIYEKRGCFFLMERAAGFPLTSFTLDAYALANNLGHGCRVAQSLHKRFWEVSHPPHVRRALRKINILRVDSPYLLIFHPLTHPLKDENKGGNAGRRPNAQTVK